MITAAKHIRNEAFMNHLCTGKFACELHTAKDVGIFNIARHAGVEDVADAEIHDRFGRSP
jgi:hypothetical protein